MEYRQGFENGMYNNWAILIKGKSGPAGIVGVLPKDKGTIMGRFMTSIGVWDSNEEEFLAIMSANHSRKSG